MKSGASTQHNQLSEDSDRRSLDTSRVPVLVNFTLSRKYLDQISAVDARIEVMRAYEEADDDARARGEEASVFEGDELRDMVRRAEIIFGFRFPIDWLDDAHNLKWVQLPSAGSDHMVREGLLEKRPDLVLTTASGVHEIPISEHIVAMILHFARGFNVATRNQAQRKWERFRPDEAHGKVVSFVGYGPIARRAASLCKALGMQVVAVRASISEQQPGDNIVNRFYPTSELNSVLAESDYIVIAAPRTPQTERMIGQEQLDSMKGDAVLVNISRGTLIDETALIGVLQDGKLKGAALDVFEKEPLPENSPLWQLPNVLITPHTAGSNPYYDRRVTDLFCDNLTRYLKGEPLKNKVEKDRGY